MVPIRWIWRHSIFLYWTSERESERGRNSGMCIGTGLFALEDTALSCLREAYNSRLLGI